ncbi:MAG: carboxypeptidase regulatory-like domain-containing protein, partial [Candidatus Sericytochromatia bacterium]|nr:carboxypeptidase regulatory-like domain-containing protein [Candidatus Tanganyikabacteria bacterium]
MRVSGAIRTSVIVLVGTTVAACSTFLPGTHVPRNAAGAGAGAGTVANPASGAPGVLQDSRLKIEGVVRIPDGDNSEGIVVRAYPAFGPPDSLYFEGVTDKNGRFSITLPDGTYNLIARRPGSTYRAIKWQVQAATFVDLDLTPTGTLKGKVVAGSLGDLTGIEVFVPGTDIVGRTDAKGNYTLNNVPQGSYQVAAKATGYGIGQAASTQVTAGQTATAGDISLSPAATAKGGLKGRLVYPDNSAAAGLTVTIDGNGANSSTATAGDGSFTVKDLPASYVRLTVNVNGFQPLSLRLVVFAGQTTDLVEEIRLVAAGGGGSTPQPSGGGSTPQPSGGGSTPQPSGGASP